VRRIVLVRWFLFALIVILSHQVWAQEPKGVEIESPTPQKVMNSDTNPRDEKALSIYIPVRIVETQDQAIAVNEREKKSDALEKANLQAQQLATSAAERAAASAERQEVIATRQMWLSVVGVLALIFTIILTVKATNAATSAAEAAHSQIADTRKHRRPLIQVNVIGRVAKGGNQLLPKHGQRMPFNLHNFGAAPANIIRYDTRILTAAKGKYPPPISPDTNAGYNTNGAIVVGPESDGPRTHSQKFDNPASDLVEDWLFLSVSLNMQTWTDEHMFMAFVKNSTQASPATDWLGQKRGRRTIITPAKLQKLMLALRKFIASLKPKRPAQARTTIFGSFGG
jgi:hypothetical protein